MTVVHFQDLFPPAARTVFSLGVRPKGVSGQRSLTSASRTDTGAIYTWRVPFHTFVLSEGFCLKMVDTMYISGSGTGTSKHRVLKPNFSGSLRSLQGNGRGNKK